MSIVIFYNYSQLHKNAQSMLTVFLLAVVHFSLMIVLSVLDLTRRECFFFRRTSYRN